ncbi:MAG: TRAP transporter large permease [Alphaproteobacteria bacterium]|jgi:C4-dicarboxylate transporter DctM subunit|nr:TRAP transporter large permease [Alphaproteobacteria bacterium]
MEALLVFLALFAVLLIGVDIAFALAGLGLALLLIGGFSPLIMPQTMMASMDNFILLAVPLFILMSNVLLRGGAGDDLFAAVQSWVGHWPGGLAVATILSCALFAAISGSSVATAATVGTVAIPAMAARGYDRRFTYGLLAAGGTLGILIPPSIPMIVYGVVMSESIVDLFRAGVVPGLMLTALFVAYAVLRARFGGAWQPEPRADWQTRRTASLRAAPTLALALVIVLGIYFGAFTPTEAAGVGFLLAAAITLGWRRSLLPADLLPIALESARTSAMILFIVAAASVFGKALTLYRIPQEVTTLVVGNIASPELFIAVTCVLLLAMGCVLEALSMMLLVVPVVQPALFDLGVDPIWFGVIFTMMIECALITPPVGLNLFVIRAVAGQSLGAGETATVGDVVRGTLPFVLLILFAVTLLIVWPSIILSVIH